MAAFRSFGWWILFSGFQLLTAQAPLEFWNWTIWQAADQPKFGLVFQMQNRWRTDNGQFLRAQGGPILDFRVHPKFSMQTGYFYQHFRSAVDPANFIQSHRPFGGFTTQLLPEGRHQLGYRAWFEYFKNPNISDGWRHRHRIQYFQDRKVSPIASGELFWDKRGWQSFRLTGGVRWAVRDIFNVQVTYFNEPLRDRPTRNVVQTSLIIQKVPFHFGP
jgi:hypothetical protein